MPAISKAWVTINDGAVDPDSPVDQALMEGMRDDLVHLREWLGASYFAGAVQDHDHDGSNSKPIAGEVGTLKPWAGHSLPGVNWEWCDGGTLSRTTYAALFALLVKEATVTMTIASPCVVTWNNHGLRDNMPIRFFTTGALPTGITAGTHGGPWVGTEYYVKVINSNTFNISTTVGGANVNTSGSQSGVHTGTVAPWGDGDGSTTFNKPDLRGRTVVGRDDMGGSAANRVTNAGSGIDGRLLAIDGGTQNHTLTTTEMPTHGHTQRGKQTALTGSGNLHMMMDLHTPNTNTSAFNTTSNAGSDGAHQNMQPSIVLDYIIRIS